MASESKGHVQAQSTVNLPRVEIRFCVKCKWNLRAAYVSLLVIIPGLDLSFDAGLSEIGVDGTV